MFEVARIVFTRFQTCRETLRDDLTDKIFAFIRNKLRSLVGPTGGVVGKKKNIPSNHGSSITTICSVLEKAIKK